MLNLLAVQASTPLYLTGEDGLRLTLFNSAAGVTAEIRGRFLPAKTDAHEDDPTVGPFAHALTPTTNRAASTRTEILGEGWLLDWSVVVTAGTPAIGQCYALVEIVRGKTGNVLPLSTLGFGYLSTSKRIGGPGVGMMDFLDGGGALRSITAAVPGAGAEISEAVPTNARWELIALKFLLTTSVGVANRVVRLALDDGTNIFYQVSTATNQAASLGVTYSAAQGVPFFAFAADSFDLLPLPDNIRLGPGMRWRTVTNQIQVADQYSAIFYLVREWIEGTS
jgi:hypothetical protein